MEHLQNKNGVVSQLGRQSTKCRSTAESTTWIGHILRHSSHLRDIIECRMKGTNYFKSSLTATAYFKTTLL